MFQHVCSFTIFSPRNIKFSLFIFLKSSKRVFSPSVLLRHFFNTSRKKATWNRFREERKKSKNDTKKLKVSSQTRLAQHICFNIKQEKNASRWWTKTFSLKFCWQVVLTFCPRWKCRGDDDSKECVKDPRSSKRNSRCTSSVRFLEPRRSFSSSRREWHLMIIILHIVRF